MKIRPETLPLEDEDDVVAGDDDFLIDMEPEVMEETEEQLAMLVNKHATDM